MGAIQFATRSLAIHNCMNNVDCPHTLKQEKKMDLIEKIRVEKVRTAEQMVIDDLKKTGISLPRDDNSCTCEVGQKAIYWILKLIESNNREGWEESKTYPDILSGVECFLANHGYDDILFPGRIDEFISLRESKDNY